MSSRNCPPSFTFITLGCKVNQYDTQLMREAVLAAGLRPAARGEPADLVVVNTCTVTRVSDEKCRQYIRKAVRQNPQAKVVVTGCYVVRDRAAVEAIEGVDAALSNDDKPQIAAIARQLASPAAAPTQACPEALGIDDFAGHTRAFVKIQDGCDSFCSYCIVPRVQGRVRSRPLDHIVAEVERLAARGFQEVVLTGIHLGAYGKDLHDPPALAQVVRELLRSTVVPRIRLSSIEALEVGDDLLAAMASSDRVCPHLHVPLQSGDDTVLRRMNRRYTAEEYLAQISKISSALDRPTVTSDVMVGFPGETDAQFERTLAVCRAAGFSRLHIFPFSPREGTPAAEFANQCSPEEIDKRKHALDAVARELQVSFERQRLGAECLVLFEHKRDPRTGNLRGYSERYVRVLAKGTDDLMGRIAPVRLTESRGGFMEGEVQARG